MHARPNKIAFEQWDWLRNSFPVFLLLAVFLGLTCDRLTAPALIWDYLTDEFTGARWAQELRTTGRWPSDFFTGYGLFHGRLMSYLLLPVFLLVKPSYPLLKLWPVAFGALTLLLTYLFVRKAFHPGAALTALFLLVIHPSFIGGIRTGNRHQSFMIFFSIGTLYGLYSWWTTGSKKALAGGLFLAGMGLGTRLWYGWFLAALAGTALVFWKDLASRLTRGGYRQTLTTLTVGFLAFVMGDLPNVWFEIRSGFNTLKIMIHPSPAPPASLFSIPERFEMCFTGFTHFMSGGWAFSNQFGGFPYYMQNEIYPYLVLVSILLGWIFFFFRDRKGNPFQKKEPSDTPAPYYAKRWLFISTLFLFMLAASTISPGARNPTRSPYLFILYPFPQILLGVAFFLGFRTLRGTKWVSIPVLTFCLLVAGEIPVLGLYHHYVRIFGGFQPFVDSTREVAGWLKANTREADVILVDDHALRTNLFFWNSKQTLVGIDWVKIPTHDLYSSSPDFTRSVRSWRTELQSLGYRKKPSIDRSQELPPLMLAPEQHFFAPWENTLADHGKNLYLVHSALQPTESVMFDLIAYWAVQRNRSFRLKAQFFEANGMGVTEIYLLKPFDPPEGGPIGRAFLENALKHPFQVHKVGEIKRKESS